MTPAPPRAARFEVLTWAKAGLFLALVVGFVAYGANRMNYNWQWGRVSQYVLRVFDDGIYPGPLLKGLFVTIEISFWSFLLALGVGLATALMRLSASLVFRGVARAYLEAIRNTPLLVQLYLFYFVLAPILDLDRYAAGVLALGLFEGAFAAEIIRAGILSVPKGQWEASSSLGLSRARAYRLVILPQALRIMLPPLTSLAVSLVKHSAIVSVIAIFDLANEARSIIADTFLTFEIWLITAAIYLVVTVAMSGAVTLLEQRLARRGTH